MPLQNKRSDTPGNRTNLIPGELAIQRADELLLIRGENRKLEVDLDRWRRRAPPAAGQAGAPLVRSGPGVAWDATKAPASYTSDGVAVDLPPPGYGLPGLDMTAFRISLPMQAQEVTSGSFYVASDLINLTELIFCQESYGTDVVRVGIATEAGEVLFDQEMVPQVGGNRIAINLDLVRGFYQTLLWTAGDREFTGVEGVRAEQGWDYFASGEPKFTIRHRDVLDLSAGLAAPAGEVTRNQPGEQHAVLMTWTL